MLIPYPEPTELVLDARCEIYEGTLRIDPSRADAETVIGEWIKCMLRFAQHAAAAKRAAAFGLTAPAATIGGF